MQMNASTAMNVSVNRIVQGEDDGLDVDTGRYVHCGCSPQYPAEPVGLCLLDGE